MGSEMCIRDRRILPERPSANPDALDAIQRADLITIGPGSWFSSVLPHTLVPQVVEAISASNALRVVVLNLSAEPGETPGFSAERHLHVLSQHAPDLRIDRILVDGAALPSDSERVYIQRAAQSLGARATFADVSHVDADGRSVNKHDPEKLSAALLELYSAFRN